MIIRALVVDGDLLALDFGDKRIGVARMHTSVRIAEPLDEIIVESEPFSDVLELISDRNPVAVVIGLPRGLEGQETTQTQQCRNFANDLAKKTQYPVYLIDEAGTTKAAQERAKAYPNASVDSLAATFLLEDFCNAKDKEALRVKL